MSIERINKIVEALKLEYKKVKFYQTIPVFNLEFYDNLLFVSFYGYKSRAKISPIFLFEKRKNSEVYKYFEKQFEKEFWKAIKWYKLYKKEHEL